MLDKKKKLTSILAAEQPKDIALLQVSKLFCKYVPDFIAGTKPLYRNPVTILLPKI